MSIDKAGAKNEILQAVDAVAADALEQACIDIAALVEDRGKLLAVRPTKLILIPDEPKE